MPDRLHSALVRNGARSRGVVVAGLLSEAQCLELISQGSVLAVWPPAEAVRRRVDHGYRSPSKPLDPGAVNCLSSHQSRLTPISTLLDLQVLACPLPNSCPSQIVVSLKIFEVKRVPCAPQEMFNMWQSKNINLSFD